MDPLRLCLAFGPLAIYFVTIGLLNLSRRSLLVSGTRDAATLGLALSGLVIIGPMELFLPQAAANQYGPYVWLLLLTCYAVCLVLLLLLMRPRLVIYNMSIDRLRPILADLVERLDPEARWAGDSLALPALGVQLHLDPTAVMRNVSLVAAGSRQNYLGWRHLEEALGQALERQEPSERNFRALNLLAAGVLILAALAWSVTRDPEAVAQALFEMLRL